MMEHNFLKIEVEAKPAEKWRGKESFVLMNGLHLNEE